MCEKACGFCGHRFFSNTDGFVAQKTRETIIELIENEGVTTFYSGHSKGYDRVCGKIVRSLKGRYKQIKLCWAVPFYMPSLDTKREYYKKLFDEIIQPDFGNLSSRKAILARNYWIVDHSDFLICHNSTSPAETAKMKEYANEKSDIHVIEVPAVKKIIYQYY